MRSYLISFDVHELESQQQTLATAASGPRCDRRCVVFYRRTPTGPGRVIPRCDQASINLPLGCGLCMEPLRVNCGAGCFSSLNRIRRCTVRAVFAYSNECSTPSDSTAAKSGN